MENSRLAKGLVKRLIREITTHTAELDKTISKEFYNSKSLKSADKLVTHIKNNNNAVVSYFHGGSKKNQSISFQVLEKNEEKPDYQLDEEYNGHFVEGWNELQVASRNTHLILSKDRKNAIIDDTVHYSISHHALQRLIERSFSKDLRKGHLPYARIMREIRPISIWNRFWCSVTMAIMQGESGMDLKTLSFLIPSRKGAFLGEILGSSFFVRTYVAYDDLHQAQKSLANYMSTLTPIFMNSPLAFFPEIYKSLGIDALFDSSILFDRMLGSLEDMANVMTSRADCEYRPEDIRYYIESSSSNIIFLEHTKELFEVAKLIGWRRFHILCNTAKLENTD